MTKFNVYCSRVTIEEGEYSKQYNFDFQPVYDDDNVWSPVRDFSLNGTTYDYKVGKKYTLTIESKV